MANSLLVNNISDVRTTVNSINWDFHPRPSISTMSPKIFDCRKYHWYPATFIPEIPYTLIELLTKPHAKVFDPFLGIGTTYFQALLLNRFPYGADISYFSVNFTKLMFSLFNPNADLMSVLWEIEGRIKEYDARRNYSKMESDMPHNVHLNKLRQWYSRRNFNALCFLMLLENKLKNDISKAALQLSISSILANVSNQDRGWGCIADNVLPKNYQERHVDVISVFMKALTKLITDIDELKNNINYKKAYRHAMKIETVFHSDISEFNLIRRNTIDLVITSPPYPNMVDYITSQRLSYYYFGLDIDFDRKNEIGARYLRGRRSALDDYLLKMNLANKRIATLLKKGGLLCYIMPSFNKDNVNNTMRREIIKTILKHLPEINLEKEIEIERTIPPLKRSHNAKWATLTSERIHIFRKT